MSVLPGESSLANVSSCLSNEVVCFGMSIPIARGMHDPPACGYALVPRPMLLLPLRGVVAVPVATIDFGGLVLWTNSGLVWTLRLGW